MPILTDMPSLIERIAGQASRLVSCTVAALLVFGLTACGGSEAVTEQDCVPGWYTNPPETSFYVRAPQAATSGNMQVALDKAKTGARGDIASRLETEVEGMTQTFTEDLAEEELRNEFIETQKTATSRVLRGTEPEDTKVCREEDGTYRAFVLMEMPIGEAAKEFNAMLKQDEDLYSRFQGSEAFQELTEAIEQLDARESGS